MKLTYYYSACVGIETPDIRILCDPWFTEGAYDGAWFHWPPFENAIDRIPEYDLIYISHIHPDHYDPKFLREYMKRWPKARVLCCANPALESKMQKDGIRQEYNWPAVSNTFIGLHPHPNGVDSALFVGHNQQRLLNLNDCPYDPWVHNFRSPTVALMAYTGAGPYPHTYYDDVEILKVKAEEQKQEFFRRYRQMDAAINAKVNIPFAGQYRLGGRLAWMNPYRGQADATEVRAFDPKAMVLDTGTTLDLDTMIATRERKERYPDPPTEDDSWLGPFLDAALKNALRHSVSTDYWFSINGYCFNAKNGKCSLGEPNSRITIDERYLYGLLTGVYHWNNAEVGSQYRVKRTPDVLNREAQNFLHHFHI